MRIERLTVQNFKKFADQTFTLHPQFTLLVGENGSGKTTVLDALAVAIGVWLVKTPDTMLNSSRRNILKGEIRLEPSREGDRIQFQQCRPVFVKVTGQIGERDNLTWNRQITTEGKITNNAEAEAALAVISDIYSRDAKGEHVLCPVLAYYGAGRAWLPSNERKKGEARGGPARRWAAFYDCFNERIRFTELADWFKRETIAIGNRKGRKRPGFEVVQKAIIGCVPDADAVWFDPDREEIILSIGGNAQPFDNLSAGQRMMLALVADIAIKAVTQNAFLLPPDELGPEDELLPRLLQKTPGVVLIDELDVHLHPRWQRRVATDLKRTFPGIQFVCTSHSPQVIGEVSRDEVRLLEPEGIMPPSVARGADSNWILDHIMDAESRNDESETLIEKVEESLEEGRLSQAREHLESLRGHLQGEVGFLTRLESRLYHLESLSHADATEEK